MTDSAKQKVAKYQALVQPTGDTPGGYCLGTGMPGSMLGSGGYPMEIVQRPEQIMIVYEAHNEVRRVYLGNRIVPDADRLPGRNGHSSGRWDGNTLVVDVTAQRDDTWFDRSGNYHSNALHVVERYTLRSPDVILYEAAIEEPNVFSRSWTIRMPLYRRLDENAQLMEFKCIPFAEHALYEHIGAEPNRN
jgi:hypothetical protein